MPSGTIYGTFSAKSTSIARPYINWSYTQNTTNNQSTITATLVFVRYDGYRVWNNDASNFTITIDGYNDTEGHAYDIGPNGKTDTIFSSSRTVTHDDDGERKVTIKASGNTNNSALGTISLSQTITLNTIARASDFTAFTLSNTTLNTSTATTINYTLGRKSSSFSHDMTLKYGSTTITSWNTGSTGSLTKSLTSTEVNKIINAMPTSTSGTLKLTMQTKSGSSNIGSSKTISETFSLSTAIGPSASGLSVSIAGTGRDKTIGQYVQNISKVAASFNRSAGYGASISSSTIHVRRQSDGGNSQTISSNSGTTANAVSLSGTYIVTGNVKDSRGRSASTSTTITVQAYSVPNVSRFTAVRKSPTTTIEYGVGASWSPLGTSNPATLTVVGKDNSNVNTSHYTVTDSTAGSISTTRIAINQSDASSYIYTVTLTDSFGKKATATINVGTSFVELTIAKGLGIGIGKVHERGALDVAGDIIINGGGANLQLYHPETDGSQFIEMHHGGVRRYWQGYGWTGTKDYRFENSVGSIAFNTPQGVTIALQGLESRGTLNIQKAGNGAELLKFGFDRPWSFYQVGDDANSHLCLKASYGSKIFYIRDANDIDVIQFIAAGTGINTIRMDGCNVYNDRWYNLTTSYSPNLYIHSDGRMHRSTSSMKYKKDVEPLWEEEYMKILDLEPIWYRSTADLDREDWSHVGLSAEAVHEIEPRLVHYRSQFKTIIDENGDGTEVALEPHELEPEGVQYSRIGVYLLPIIKKQQSTIEELKSRLSKLEEVS